MKTEEVEEEKEKFIVICPCCGERIGISNFIEKTIERMKND